MPPPEHAVGDAVVALGRALRRAGVPTVVEDELLLAQALAEIDVRRRERVYWAARSVFVRRPSVLPTFDWVFDRFWGGLALDMPGELVAEHGETDQRMTAPQHGGAALPQFRADRGRTQLLDAEGASVASALEIPTAAAEEPGRGRRRGVLAAYSPEEVLTEREPLAFDDDELDAVRRLAEELRHSLPLRRSRRLGPARRGRIDVRRTVRAALETDGEMIRPAYSAHSLRPRRLLLLCDVSGSMERYSRSLLASLRAAVGASAKTEAFVFATQLTRLTGSLSGHDVERALEEARAAVPDWFGGTRIGSVLAEFRRAYGRLGLARGAIVLVASDGWDRGDQDLLAAELAALRLLCRRLVWLNPRPADLAGQPLAVGLRTALPFVDDYVTGTDADSIAALVRALGRLETRRPGRAQRVRGFA